MDVTALPTDNLYKFCAILGLTFLIFNTYYNFEMKSKSKIDNEILVGDFKKNNYEWKLLIADLEELNNTLKESNASMKENLHVADSLLNLSKLQTSNAKASSLQDKALYFINENTNLAKSTDSLNHKLEIRKIEVKLKSIDVDVKSKIAKIQNAKIQTYSSFLGIGTMIGLLLSIYGFYNWFMNQKIIDQNLRSNP